MRPKRTTEKVEAGRALFHPQNPRAKILAAYRRKLVSLGLAAV